MRSTLARSRVIHLHPGSFLSKTSCCTPEGALAAGVRSRSLARAVEFIDKLSRIM